MFAPIAPQLSIEILAAATVIVAVGFPIAFRLASQALQSEGATRLAWVLFTGLVGGGSAWATYFTALAALSLGTTTVYDAVLALQLLGVLVPLATAATFIETRPSGPLLQGLGMPILFAVGVGTLAIVGPGIISLPRTLALREGRPPALDAAVIALVFALAAIRLFRRARIVSTSPLRLHAAPGLLLAFGMLAACIASFSGIALSGDGQASIESVMSDRDVSPTVFIVGLTAFVLVFDLAACSAVLITEHDRAAQVRRTRELVDAAVEGLAIIRDGKIASVNRPLLELIGFNESELVGSDPGKLLLPSEGGREGTLDLSQPPPASGTVIQARLSRTSGLALPVEVVVRPFGPRGAERVMAIRDVSERLAAEAQIRHLAHHDGLTNLPNRTHAYLQLNDCLRRSRHLDERFAVMLLDLDHFKEVNDRYGHAAGDDVLRQASERVTALLGDGGYMARLGGDEFLVVLSEHRSKIAAKAKAFSDDLQRAFPTTLDLGHNRQAVVGVSAGIALLPDDGKTIEDLLSNADLALYRVKRDGRGGVGACEPEMDAAIRARRRLAAELKAVLQDNGRGLELHYQPQIHLETGEISGLEALARWHHPERGIVPPAEFIPIAEEAGLIVALGEWVIDAACREAIVWPQPFRVAINISTKHLMRAALTEFVRETLLRTGLSPQRLEIEITESAFLEDRQAALDTLRSLKALGVAVALDDFGTGYSSLSLLQLFHFDKMKIDRSFIAKLNRDGKDCAIVDAMLGLGRSLGVLVLAEGVETLEQKNRLMDMGCAEGQGFYYSKPLPPLALHDFFDGMDSAFKCNVTSAAV